VASAIVSVLALVGIVSTLSYQTREAKPAREETRRQAVGDLLKMAMEGPDLDECWDRSRFPTVPEHASGSSIPPLRLAAMCLVRLVRHG
jgi:hypothetical protein